MTKKKVDELIEATNKGSLFDWLYNNQENVSKDELATIARELAYAIEQPQEAIKKTFVEHISDYYETFGYDEEDE